MNGNRENTHPYDDSGNPDDERTVKLKTGQSARTSGASDLSDSEYDARTTRMDESDLSDDEEMTRLIGGGRRGRRTRSLEDRLGNQDAMDDPPAGWLVIVKGPGKGNALTVGYGMNSVGRARGERVCMNFGDEQVSRKGHAIITYDSRGRKFYVQQGRGTNLVYMEDEVVLSPRELPPFSNLLIGETTLRFVPLCGDAFDWHEHSES